MVETYLNEEFTDILFEEDAKEEWKSLVQELGIEGQEKAVSGQAKSSVPYPYMNKGMINVYGTLCPNKMPYTKYSQAPIPLEVLKTIKYCIHEGFFQEIEIWADTQSPDPIVVGKTCQYYCYDIENGRKMFGTKESLKEDPDYKGNDIYINNTNRS